jgi:hypothetical protein
MNIRSDDHQSGRLGLAIGVWENEGGALAPGTPSRQYGRRVEMDRSWTVYHVFTGAPARLGGNPMTGLSRSEATDGMLSLNHARARRGREPSVRQPSSSPIEPACDQ